MGWKETKKGDEVRGEFDRKEKEKEGKTKRIYMCQLIIFICFFTFVLIFFFSCIKI